MLIELDPTMTTAEQEHIRSDLIAAQLDVARLRAALSDNENPQSRVSAACGRKRGSRRHAAAISGRDKPKNTVLSLLPSIGSARRKKPNALPSRR